MKLIGFIKEHDPLKEAIPYEAIHGEANDAELLSKILTYLAQGKLLFAWMEYCTDIDDNSLIAPHAYFTDGTWVWPSYFPYYLNKVPDYSLNKEFVTYLEDHNFDQKNEIDLSRMEKEFIKILKGEV